ncbi:MAG: hypothetical protein IKS30_05760 [Treponema sp.]|nr:hypothetical protein [Treponema sp.]
MIKISELPTSAERTSMVLQRVYEHRGNIQSFKYDDGKCLFTLQNCSEKEIVQNEACSVSFDFLGQLTLGYRVCDPFPADGIYYPGAADFIELLNKKFASCGVFATHKKLAFGSVHSSTFVPEYRIGLVMEIYLYCCNSFFWHEDCLNINCTGDGCYIDAVFSHGVKAGHSLCSSILSYSVLFKNEEAPVKIKKYYPSNSTVASIGKAGKKRFKLFNIFGLSLLLFTLFASCASIAFQGLESPCLVHGTVGAGGAWGDGSDTGGPSAYGTPDSPVIQVEVTNTSQKTISAVTVCFNVYDSAGNPDTEDGTEYVFTKDCLLEAGQSCVLEFKIKSPAEETAGQYVLDFVYLSQVIFSDGVIWHDCYGVFAQQERF